MELTWYGLGCFRITERGMSTIITDPYNEKSGFSSPKVKGEVVTICHKGSDISRYTTDHISGLKHTIDGPGEFELGGVFIHGIASPRKTIQEKRNVIFVFNFSGLTIAHLGELNKVPSQTQIDALGSVNILLLPVGGHDVLSASQASEVVSMIEPSIVIPMMYQEDGLKYEYEPLDKFVREMGITEVAYEPSLKMTKSSLPEELQVVFLEPKR
jgi:L-ascorbate metabolism protein UlaG (beta-lactamase superfamily)